MGSLCINIDSIDPFFFRAVKASYSLAFAEVIVACEIINNVSKHMIDDNNTEGKKTIYLHLKKYFRGTRFTYLPFLKKVEAKHKSGDVVCVSGKVSRISLLDVVIPCIIPFVAIKLNSFTHSKMMVCELNVNQHYASILMLIVC